MIEQEAYVAELSEKKCITLRVLASRLEEADRKSTHARALLEKAGLVNPNSNISSYVATHTRTFHEILS